MRLELPYPPKELHPNRMNGRHWSRTSGKKKKYKQDCCFLAKSVSWNAKEFKMTFHPPDNRRRDIDNAIAACKYLIDGVALAIGCDDSELIITYPRKFGEPTNNGMVVIEA